MDEAGGNSFTHCPLQPGNVCHDHMGLTVSRISFLGVRGGHCREGKAGKTGDC